MSWEEGGLSIFQNIFSKGKTSGPECFRVQGWETIKQNKKKIPPQQTNKQTNPRIQGWAQNTIICDSGKDGVSLLIGV